jgi:hypothetical protein
MWIFFFLSEYTVLPILVYWRVATLRNKFAYYESNMRKSISSKDLDIVQYLV